MREGETMTYNKPSLREMESEFKKSIMPWKQVVNES